VKRGFTLLETLLACSLSVIVFAAIFSLLSAVWLLTKENSDELQGALRARAARERLYYACFDEGGAHKGLVSATNIHASASEIVAAYKGGFQSIRAVKPADLVLTQLDASKSSSAYRDADKSLQFIYLAVETGTQKDGKKTVYYNRMVVPVWGRHPDMTEIRECFGE